MGLLNLFFSPHRHSAAIAKERLKIVLAHERAELAANICSATIKRLGLKRARLAVAILAAVDRRDRRVDLDPGRDRVSIEAERLAAD